MHLPAAGAVEEGALNDARDDVVAVLPRNQQRRGAVDARRVGAGAAIEQQANEPSEPALRGKKESGRAVRQRPVHIARCPLREQHVSDIEAAELARDGERSCAVRLARERGGGAVRAERAHALCVPSLRGDEEGGRTWRGF